MFKKMKLTLNLFLMITFITGFSNASLSFARDISSIEIHVNSGVLLQVQLLLTDPYGNKTGFDSSINASINQIPDSGSDTEDIPGLFPTNIIVVGKPKNGTYNLNIIGMDQTNYKVEISIRDSSGATYESEYIGFTSEGLISTYKIIYDPTPGIAPLMERIITIEDVRNDVNIAYNLNLITNSGIRQSLLSKLDVIESAINRGQKKTATNQLNAFINEVNAQKGKHMKDEAIKILIEDAEYLINHL